MIILKWLMVLLPVGYLGGVALLFFRQRQFLFPIPLTGRMSPEAAGFPQAEEQMLTSADGERVIIWHVPKPGHPVALFLHGNGDSLPSRVERFRGIVSDDTGLVALAHQPKQFVRLPEGGHDNLDHCGALDAAQRFIDGSNG